MNILKIYNLLLITTTLIFKPNLVFTQEAEQNYRSCLTYYEKGAYQQALHTINKALEIDSSKAEYFLQRANIHYNLGSYDNTIKDCYATLRLRPDVPEVYLLRGKVCIVTKSYGPAILFFGKVLKYTNEGTLRFEAYLNRGKAFSMLNRYEDALADFNEAYTIDNSSLELLLPLSETYLDLKKPDQAIQILNNAIAQNPDYAPVYELLGRIAYENHDFPKAVSAYEEYAILNPNSAEACNTLAGLYLQMNEFVKAFGALDKALTIDPLEPNAYKIKGMIYIAQGDNEKGCNTLFRAMQLGYFEKYSYDLLDIYRSTCE